MTNPQDPRLLGRVALLASALAMWRQGSLLVWSGAMPMHPVAVVLVGALFLSGFFCLLAALVNKDQERLTAWATATFVVVLIAFAYKDALTKDNSPALGTTDAHIFMDVAARFFVKGKNPYDQSLLEAFRVYRMPLSYSTPLIDGDVSDRVAYPSLSFLVLVPFVLLGIPTHYAYAICFVLGVILAIWRAPSWLRLLVLALFTLDETYLMFSFGGVTDTVWMLCLVVTIAAWAKRPTLAAISFGLACAYKQHPWFIVPFLVVLLWREHRQPVWKGPALRFFAIAFGVFALLNVPFLIWNPRAWVLGAFEPLLASMIQLSEGLTAMSMTGYVVLPKSVTSAIFFSVYGLSLFAYARHTALLRPWCWVVSGVTLWFNHRALTSYWYFEAILATAALVSWTGKANEEASEQVSPRPTWIAAGVVGAAIAAVVVVCALRPAPFKVTIRSPSEAWEVRVFKVRARVENKTDRVMEPRFAVQSAAQQPLEWVILQGPLALGPGASADYVVAARHGYEEFDVALGARLSVSDRGDPGVRAVVDVPGELSFRVPDAVPNPRFQVVEKRTQIPAAWSLERSDDAVKLSVAPELEGPKRIELAFGGEDVAKLPLAQCVASQKLEGASSDGRFGNLFATLVLPETDTTFGVNVPAGANVAPWTRLYGVRVALPGWQALVLFGAEGEGTLPNGARYVGVPSAREAWTKVTVNLRSVLTRLGAPLHMQRFPVFRHRDVDVPFVPVELGMYAAMPRGEQGAVSFGGIEHVLRATPAVIFERGGPMRQAEIDAWHASWNLEHHNHGKAATLLQSVADRAPTKENYVLLGDALLLTSKPEEARAAYLKAVALGGSREASKGLGYASSAAGDLDGAVTWFTRAKDQYAATDTEVPRRGYMDCLIGLAATFAKKGDCQSAKKYADEAHRESPELRLELPSEKCPELKAL